MHSLIMRPLSSVSSEFQASMPTTITASGITSWSWFVEEKIAGAEGIEDINKAFDDLEANFVRKIT